MAATQDECFFGIIWLAQPIIEKNLRPSLDL